MHIQISTLTELSYTFEGEKVVLLNIFLNIDDKVYNTAINYNILQNKELAKNTITSSIESLIERAYDSL